MYQSKLILNTQDGERIIGRLAKHWSHKFDIVNQGEKTIIPFSEENQVILSADNEQLLATLTTNDEESQPKLQEVVLNHINRMAGVEFEAQWQI
ncbi:DUF2218 domain-containing protein [Faucicola mancuniensis]|uniref:DUF2218 domain-containing protein n=1 Tax=Faucicola mancuniensis TaxID=1309795 RepID=UPI003977495C